ncbi:LysR substrate-binding domain-containing protein [Klebsiella pneumoniae]|nr:LysR substrate-binding domain-containing protein [Klebsiella pneumoniae]
MAPGLYELVYNSCLRAGIDMERAWRSSQISSSLSMVNAGFGFALVPQCDLHPAARHQLSPAWRAPLKTDIAIAWRRFERSRTVKRFLAMF